MKAITLAAVAIAATAHTAPAAPPLVEYASYSIVHTMPNGAEIRALVKTIEQRFNALERATGRQTARAVAELKASIDALERALDDEGMENKIRIDLQRLIASLRSAIPGDGSVRQGDGSVRDGDGSVRQGDGSVRPEEMGAMRTAVKNLVVSYGK